MKLTIRGRLPTLNEMINASKAGKYVYSEMKSTNDDLVAWSAHEQKIPLTQRADYEILWICKDKRFDKDNIIAGQKFIFDGLRKARKIQNDGWNQIGKITHDFAVDKLNPRVEITITEVAQ